MAKTVIFVERSNVRTDREEILPLNRTYAQVSQGVPNLTTFVLIKGKPPEELDRCWRYDYFSSIGFRHAVVGLVWRIVNEGPAQDLGGPPQNAIPC